MRWVVRSMDRWPRRYNGAALTKIDKLREAIDAAAAQPGALAPREQFVDDLHRRLKAEVDGEIEDRDTTDSPRRQRRRVLQMATGVVVAAFAGAGAERAVHQSRQPGPSDQGPLAPELGTWTTLVPTADVPAGQVFPFSVAHVVGVVVNDGSDLRALSTVCTHQGCLLSLDAAQRRLNCPCHSTAFSLTGAVLHHALTQAPLPLPHLSVRERDGQIQVLLPPA